MIGVDTNVLVRYLTADDERQARTVGRFFDRTVEADEGIHIDDIVLCELVWVLGAAYRFERMTIAAAVAKILNTAVFTFNDRDLLRQALAEYERGPGDFADYVIGRRNLAAGCIHTVTFDRPLKGNGAFALL